MRSLSSNRRALGIPVLLALLVIAEPAQGDECHDLATEGWELLNKGDPGAASSKFEASVALCYSPVVRLHWAKAERSQSHLLRAAKILLEVEKTPIETGAKQSWHAAVNQARLLRQEIIAETPKITVQVTGDAAGDAEVSIDGRSVTPGTPVEVDPGKHDVHALAGALSASKTVELTAGASELIELELASAERAATAPVGPDEPPLEDGPPLLPIIAFAIGGAGLVATAIVGPIYLGKVGDVDDACPDGRCRDTPENRATFDDAETLGLVTTVTFAAMVLGAAAGTVLLLTASDGEASLEASPWIGPHVGGSALRGTF